MALTKISTGGVKDDAVTAGKIPANAVGSSEIADDAVDQGAIADEAVDEARLQISNAGTNGQFLSKQSGNTGGLTWADANSYTPPNHSGEVTSTGDGATVIASNIVDEDNLKISNAGTNGQVLSKQSGNTGGLTWTDLPASAPQIEATADGDITAGDPIIVKPDGDVKKVGLAITVLNPPTVSTDKTRVTTDNLTEHNLFWIPSLKKIVFGFKNASDGDDFEVIIGEVTDDGDFTWATDGTEVDAGTLSGPPAFTYDTNSNKLVAVWRDSGTSDINSIVGTISGNSISFGTKVAIDSNGAGGVAVCFDSTNNKVVATWIDDTGNNSYAVSAVGTVSGTGISWGTAVDVNAYGTDITHCTYDPDTQRVLAVTRKSSDLQINSHVGTVSGTSISWGSATEIVSAGLYPEIVYDTENNKAVVGYITGGNTCSAKVGTVTGSSTNSISWGSAGTWWNSGNIVAHRTTYDDYTRRVIVQFRRETPPSNQQKFHIASGGVSGTSITFTNDAIQTDQLVYGANTTGLCMAQKGQIISIARHGALDQDTYSWRGLAGTGATDLTTENYVGLAAATVANDATATVDVSGATNTSQSSLTPGQKYFVQGDGTLGLTADTPKVYAGTAISATKLIVNDAPIASAAGWTTLTSGTTTSGNTFDITTTHLTSSYQLYRLKFDVRASGDIEDVLYLQQYSNGAWKVDDYRVKYGQDSSYSNSNTLSGLWLGNLSKRWLGTVDFSEPYATDTSTFYRYDGFTNNDNGGSTANGSVQEHKAIKVGGGVNDNTATTGLRFLLSSGSNAFTRGWYVLEGLAIS